MLATKVWCTHEIEYQVPHSCPVVSGLNPAVRLDKPSTASHQTFSTGSHPKWPSAAGMMGTKKPTNMDTAMYHCSSSGVSEAAKAEPT